MKFQDFEYVRPDYEKTKKEMTQWFKRMNEANSAGEAIRCAVEIDKIRQFYTSMKNLSGLRFSIDTTDPYYVAENDHFDEYWPLYKELTAQYYRVVLASPYLEDLRAFYGNQFIRVAECTIKTIDEKILPELQEEARLISAYFRVKTDAIVEFRGQKMNLSELSGYVSSSDRQTRIEATEAFYGYFESRQDDLDELFDKMVKLRDKKAKMLGYKNYIEMGYDEMNRTDYDADMVKHFRDQVKEYVVPVVGRLIERQKKRLGVTELPYYDESIRFLSGNARPFGTPEQILQQAKSMYEEMSPETGEYFNYMLDTDLIDVIPRHGKEGSGFSTYIGTYRAPFLFANFNGTSGDVNLMTHEAGHAFQSYMSRHFDTPELPSATMETAETHSKSMELFTLPYIDRFFDGTGDKYRFEQVEESLEFIPYGAAVDEFQHLVYENPEATPAERRQMWRSVEKKYLPHRFYKNNPFLESGTWWFKQGHPFFRPFYYIDYVLAQVCAFEFMEKMDEDYQSAWDSYVELCRQGGSKSFVELLKMTGLDSPFEDGAVQSIAEYAERYLNRFDDMSM